MLIHTGPLAGVAAQGDWVATAGYDNRVILWDARNKVSVAQGMHDHLANQCAFSADGRWLVSASSDYSARVWSLPDMRLHAVLADHGDDVDMAVFSPDDQWIATCALDRLVRVFDRQGQCRQRFAGHTGNVLALAWARDGQSLVSTSVDGTIRRWCVKTGQQRSCTRMDVRTDSLELDADGTIYAGDDRGRLAVIRGDSTSYVAAHQAGIKKVVLDQAHRQLIALSYDGTMSVWQIQHQTLTLRSRTRLPSSIWARSAAVMGDGRIAVATFGSTYAIYEPATQQWDVSGVQAGDAVNAVLKTQDHVYTIGDAGELRCDGEMATQLGSLCNFLVQAGDWLLTGGQLGQLLDARTAQVMYEHHSPINCAVTFFSGRQRMLALGTYTGEIVWLKVDAHAIQLDKVVPVYENAIKGLAVCEGQLFSACANTDIAWHSLDDGTPLRYISHAHEKIVNDCVTIDATHVATVSRDRQLKIWNGQGHETYPTPHHNSVKCMAIDASCQHILTGSYGGTVAWFNLKQRQWTHVERPTTAGISDISWDAQQHLFWAASYDGQIYPIRGA
jgi:WD40 repeat protein